LVADLFQFLGLKYGHLGSRFDTEMWLHHSPLAKGEKKE